MGAYIINIPNTVDRIIYVNVGPDSGRTYISSHRVEDLTPYTEPDLEQARKEAYEQGLSDAWGCTRKIRGMTWDEQREVFGTDYYTDIIALPASECIEKIRQYEQEKEEQIQVGDEVIPRETEYDTMIVTRLWKDDYDSDCIDAIGFDGRISSFLVSRVSKTGKHYEIAEVLAKMKETDNG